MTPTKFTMEFLSNFATKYGHNTVTLKKVWLCPRTNSIKARFASDILGSFQGTVKPDFEVTTTMDLSDALANITIEILNPSKFMFSYAETCKFSFE